MIVINKIEELEKFKTEDFINKDSKQVIHYNFLDDVTFNLPLDLMQTCNTIIILKGKNFEFKHKVLTYGIRAKGNITSNSFILAESVSAKGNVSVNELECDYLQCYNLYGKYLSISDNLVCNNVIVCDELCVEHFSSFKKLSAKTMVMNGSLFYNISAESEVFKLKPKKLKFLK